MKLYNKNELKHSRIFFDKKPPKFGIVFVEIVFLLLVLTIVIMSVVVRPYVVKADGIVTTIDNQYIASSISGNVVEIVFKEGSIVSAGDTLVIISNGQESVQTNAVISQLETLSLKENALAKYLNAIESGVNTLSKSVFEIEYYGKMEYYIDQINNASIQESINSSAIDKKKEKLSLSRSDLQILKDQLAPLKIIIDTGVEKEKNTEDQLQITEIKEKIESKELEIEGLIEEIDKLKQQKSMNTADSAKLQLLSEAGQVNTTLATQRTELEGQLNVYLGQDNLFEIKAANDGEVHYLTPIHLGMGIQQNQVFAEISAHEDEQKIIEVYLNAFNRSNVAVGQKVNVNVLGVNSTQYGMLKGVIVNIENGTISQETDQESQSFYRIQIIADSYRLEGGDGDKTIEILKSMPVQAQIVYEEETYLMWILEMLSLKK